MRQSADSKGTPTVAALSRSLALLEAVLADRDGSSMATIAARVGLPKATAHRQATTLLQDGFLRRLATGQLIAGPRLVALAQMLDHRQVVVAAAAPVLHRLALKLGCVAQSGTLENDMVTYRIKTGQGAEGLFTRVGLQLEAYCTGIGKVLLAHLSEREREAYLATGPFPALTTHTITEPAALRVELQRIRAQGYARDNEEITEGLVCFAAPLRIGEGEVVAAISVSRLTEDLRPGLQAATINALLSAACEIEAAIRTG
ncbi:DNA-binding IclR family transcriptional regulator [Novosphingobium hassiacum]|uniref:DNA-binding IclR family transcriptional regulator n=1 Tax=Novosphingobium hassiacum TaxID=173676 RepID=A0A7W6EVT8_9SPHN|nr:IclR family transcriptional regulator [Novosphingobium hassiacum]MBB3860029.1 DNA-binding IclR family transcriptional regulator [Novosphingobium hassiacum]